MALPLGDVVPFGLPVNGLPSRRAVKGRLPSKLLGGLLAVNL